MTEAAPTEQQRVEALSLVLAGVERGDDVLQLTESLSHLHSPKNTFPGEVFMALGADALTLHRALTDKPIPYEDLARVHLPELNLGRADATKLRTAILLSASLSAGLEPDLFDDVAWWRTDDYWTHATWAAIGLIRASAQHRDIPVTELVHQLAERHSIKLA